MVFPDRFHCRQRPDSHTHLNILYLKGRNWQIGFVLSIKLEYFIGKCLSGNNIKTKPYQVLNILVRSKRPVFLMSHSVQMAPA